MIGNVTDLRLQHTDKVVISAPAADVSGTLTVAGAATADSLNITGDATLAGAVTIGSLDILNDLNVTGVITCASNLHVTGGVEITQGLVIHDGGLSIALGTLYVESDGAQITGQTILNDLVEMRSGLLVTTGNVEIEDNIFVRGTGQIDGNLTVGGDCIPDRITVQTTAYVAGNMTANADLNVAGAANIQALNVSGSALITGNLAVLEDTLIEANLHVTGTLTAGSVDVTGGASIKGTLEVTGAASFNNIISCASEANLTRLNLSSTGVVQSTLTVQNLDVTGGIAANNYGTASDARLKKDISEIEGALAKVAALRPVEYNWNTLATMNPAHKEIGFIAQEVEAVVPAVVMTSEDEIGTKRVGYDRLTALLVAAVKEQSAVIAGLEARLAALEGRC